MRKIAIASIVLKLGGMASYSGSLAPSAWGPDLGGPGDAPPTLIHAECSKGSIPVVKRLLSKNFGVAHALYHVTLSRGGSKITTGVEFLTPIYLFTMPLLCIYDDD